MNNSIEHCHSSLHDRPRQSKADTPAPFFFEDQAFGRFDSASNDIDKLYTSVTIKGKVYSRQSEFPDAYLSLFSALFHQACMLPRFCYRLHCIVHIIVTDVYIHI